MIGYGLNFEINQRQKPGKRLMVLQFEPKILFYYGPRNLAERLRASRPRPKICPVLLRPAGCAAGTALWR